MGERERTAAEALRAKYARVFNVSKEAVEVEHFINTNDREDARIYCKLDMMLPIWTLGTSEIKAPGWVTNHKVKTW